MTWEKKWRVSSYWYNRMSNLFFSMWECIFLNKERRKLSFFQVLFRRRAYWVLLLGKLRAILWRCRPVCKTSTRNWETMLASPFPSTAIWKRYVQACCDFNWCQESYCLIMHEWCSRIFLSIYASLTMPKGLSDLWFIRQWVGCLINLHVCSAWYSGQLWVIFFLLYKLSFLPRVSDNDFKQASRQWWWPCSSLLIDLCPQSMHALLTERPRLLSGIP